MPVHRSIVPPWNIMDEAKRKTAHHLQSLETLMFIYKDRSSHKSSYVRSFQKVTAPVLGPNNWHDDVDLARSLRLWNVVENAYRPMKVRVAERGGSSSLQVSTHLKIFSAQAVRCGTWITGGETGGITGSTGFLSITSINWYDNTIYISTKDHTSIHDLYHHFRNPAL